MQRQDILMNTWAPPPGLEAKLLKVILSHYQREAVDQPLRIAFWNLMIWVSHMAPTMPVAGPPRQKN